MAVRKTKAIPKQKAFSPLLRSPLTNTSLYYGNIINSLACHKSDWAGTQGQFCTFFIIICKHSQRVHFFSKY